MDKKAKKRIEVLRKRITKLQMLLNAAREQMDDPSEVKQLEADMAAAHEEVEKLKDS
jgi:hypothetical protein